MQLKDTGFSYAVSDTFTWGLIQTPSSKTFMWSRTHGSHSHRFIPVLCVLNRSLVLSSVGSPIPLLTLSHGALLREGLNPSVASSTGAAHYPSVVFLLSMRPSFAAQPMFIHVPVVYQHTLRKVPDIKQNLLKSTSSYGCWPGVTTCYDMPLSSILDHYAPFADIQGILNISDNFNILATYWVILCDVGLVYVVTHTTRNNSDLDVFQD